MSFTLSFTASVKVTLVVVVGVPLTLNPLPPELEALRPLPMLTSVPLVGRAVPFNVKT